jgi:hypothetical protein
MCCGDAMINLAIMLWAIATVYWTVRELVLNSFKDISVKKPFIVGFALVGLTIAVAVVVVPQVVSYSIPAVVTAFVFCPSSLVNILVLVTFRYPPLSWLVAVQTFIAIMNTALYAAIGGRVAGLFLSPQNS